VQSGPNVTGHDPPPAFQFTPGARAFDEPGHTRPEDWNPDPPQGRERYAPGYAKAFKYLDHQVSVFRRGDSCLVVAAYDLSKDTALADQPARAALVLTQSERDVVVRDHEARLDRPDVLAATAPCGRQVLSLEVAARARRSVARARYGLSLDENSLSSDLLLLEGSDSLPTDLPQADNPSVAGRALGLDLSSISPGPYRIEVIVTARGRASVTMRRDIELVRP